MFFIGWGSGSIGHILGAEGHPAGLRARPGRGEAPSRWPLNPFPDVPKQWPEDFVMPPVSPSWVVRTEQGEGKHSAGSGSSSSRDGSGPAFREAVLTVQPNRPRQGASGRESALLPAATRARPPSLATASDHGAASWRGCLNRSDLPTLRPAGPKETRVQVKYRQPGEIRMSDKQAHLLVEICLCNIWGIYTNNSLAFLKFKLNCSHPVVLMAKYGNLCGSPQRSGSRYRRRRVWREQTAGAQAGVTLSGTAMLAAWQWWLLPPHSLLSVAISQWLYCIKLLPPARHQATYVISLI